jgi:hypothetical protein
MVPGRKGVGFDVMHRGAVLLPASSWPGARSQGWGLMLPEGLCCRQQVAWRQNKPGKQGLRHLLHGCDDINCTMLQPARMPCCDC